MFFTSLPPELLLDIFKQAAGKLPSRTDEQALSRTTTLCSLTLVHSSFRPIAQSLLPKEITRTLTNDEKPLAFDSVSTPFSGVAVEHLRLLSMKDPSSHRLTDSPPTSTLLQRCTNNRLVTLTLRGQAWARIEIDLVKLGGFAHLEELRLELCIVAVSDSDLSFPVLRRIVFYGTSPIPQHAHFVNQILSPTSMPNLIHLAADLTPLRDGVSCLELFDSLLPQVHSLALRYAKEADIFRFLSHSMPHLEHLSLHGGEHLLEENLFGHAARLRLKTLHLDAYEILVDQTLTTRLSNAVAQGTETVKLEKVVLYGDRERTQQWTGAEVDRYGFVWAKAANAGEDSEQTPPFFAFDGSYEESPESGKQPPDGQIA